MHPAINFALARGGYVTFPTLPVGFAAHQSQLFGISEKFNNVKRFSAWLPRWESQVTYPAEIAPCKQKPCRWHITA